MSSVGRFDKVLTKICCWDSMEADRVEICLLVLLSSWMMPSSSVEPVDVIDACDWPRFPEGVITMKIQISRPRGGSMLIKECVLTFWLYRYQHENTWRSESALFSFFFSQPQCFFKWRHAISIRSMNLATWFLSMEMLAVLISQRNTASPTFCRRLLYDSSIQAVIVITIERDGF